ncbi:MAG: hypothetical protein AAGC67_11185 [Myxococcota bacterium]
MSKTRGSNVDDRLRITRPCPIDWASRGEEPGGRFCDHCRKDVLDVEAMSSEELETLVASGEEVCVRIARLPDGSLLTRDTPRARRVAAMASAAVAASAIGCGETGEARGEPVRFREAGKAPHFVPTDRVDLGTIADPPGVALVYTVGGLRAEVGLTSPPAMPGLDLSPTVPFEAIPETSSVMFGGIGATTLEAPEVVWTDEDEALE